MFARSIIFIWMLIWQVHSVDVPPSIYEWIEENAHICEFK
jgi:hypothetical protein